MLDVFAEALALHRANRGKLVVKSKVPVTDKLSLSLAYSPGVAEPCRAIAADPEEIWQVTGRGNFVAVVSDGTAVLGLGDIGPLAALPVMEGKSVLFKTFAGVDAFPVCLDTKDPGEIVETVCRLAPTFGGVNLEDISAPRCFEIEEALIARLEIPVFHDDQHGTAVVALAGLENALKLVGKTMGEIRVVMNGAGAAGVAITNLLLSLGVGDIIVCDRQGAIYQGRGGLNASKERLAAVTNRERRSGSLADVVRGGDVFIGVSDKDQLTAEMVRTMGRDPIIFALANPDPEIRPEIAKAAGARIVATGRSDVPNQVNNVLGFPGIFRGALDVRARRINEPMKLAAARAIAAIAESEGLSDEYIIPGPFDRRVAPAVAAAVAQAAMESGVARVQVDPEEVRTRTQRLVEEG